MPRPTVAQLAYGTCTVVLSTFALLLLSRTGSAVGITFVAVAALALGVLVAMAPPLARPRSAAARQPAPLRSVRTAVPAPVRTSVREPVREPVRERAAS